MSFRDTTELPQEHIFTLVLFFRDQTRGNTELLCSSSHRLRQPARVFPHRTALSNVLSSPLLSSPSFCKGVMATQQLEQMNCILLPMCHLGFFLIISCHLLFICQSFLLFPLVLYFIFKIIYSLSYLPNLAFHQCVCFILFFLCCFPMGDSTSYLTLHTRRISPPLLDTCKELSVALFCYCQRDFRE